LSNLPLSYPKEKKKENIFPSGQNYRKSSL